MLFPSIQEGSNSNSTCIMRVFFFSLPTVFGRLSFTASFFFFFSFPLFVFGLCLCFGA